jgi:hypothetical protein
MFSVQEQEHIDHEIGAYHNEFQAAYALSRREQGNGDRANIDGLVLAGAYVVVAWVNQYCGLTDAALPALPFVREWYLTRAEAEAAVARQEGDDEVRFGVEPKLGVEKR